MNEALILVIEKILILFMVFLSCLLVSKELSVREVNKQTDEEKVKYINEALSKYGFLLDMNDDIVYSSISAPQRMFGYCRLYDELAPLLNINIDCEPIYFQYDGKRWLIEFWKGQYGMETGAEIGVYSTDKPDINIPGIFSGTLYECVSDDELLDMEYALIRNEQLLIKRREKHWWLTGFDVGTFSDTDELTLEVKIVFPSLDMQRAFIGGLQYAGYNTNDIIRKGKMVQVVFKTPKTKQRKKFGRTYLSFIQKKNKLYCNIFNWLTKDFTRTIDKIYFLKVYWPKLFKVIVNNKSVEKLSEIYQNVQDYINKA